MGARRYIAENEHCATTHDRAYMTRRLSMLLLVSTAVTAGCAFVPKQNLRLEEARAAYRQAQADPLVVALAGNELRAAGEAQDRAIAASNSLDDPAVVDHLAYLAKQRAAISRETAQLIAAQRGLIVSTTVARR
jgi:hypothetical protein